MDRREEIGRTEFCVFCGEEVDLGDPAAHAKVRGRTVCSQCARRQGGTFDPESETWVHAPGIPEALLPKED